MNDPVTLLAALAEPTRLAALRLLPAAPEENGTMIPAFHVLFLYRQHLVSDLPTVARTAQ